LKVLTSPSKIRKKLFSEEWIELLDNRKLLRQQQMRTRTLTSLRCLRVSWFRRCGLSS
jgi:hypothetical protein